MTSNNPTDCVGDFEGSISEPQTLPSPDLIDQPGSKIGDSCQSTSQNSPSKRSGNESSPSKSRNRRKNDSRRRSGSHKKQQAANNDQSERQSQIPKLSNTPSSEQHIEVKRIDSTTSDQETNRNNSPTQVYQQQQKHTYDEDKRSDEAQQKQSHIIKEHEKANKELRGQLERQNLHIQGLVHQTQQQINKVKELETALISTTRTCTQLEKLLQQELSSRTRLEAENESLNQTITRLKKQLSVHEKNKFNNDELMRVLNATLMERETEVSILKLKLTRMQTNPSSTMALNSASSVSSVKQEPSQVFATSGRSNSEFNRNSYIRSSMLAEAASVRSSTSQLRSMERDASVWATVPEELTPSKRPLILDRNFQSGESYYNPYGNINSLLENDTSTPLVRNRLYKTLPRSMKSPSQEFSISNNVVTSKQPPKDEIGLEDTSNMKQHATHCQVTNLDDSSSTNQSNKTSNSPMHEDNKRVLPREGVSLPHTSKANDKDDNRIYEDTTNMIRKSTNTMDSSHYSTISKTNINFKPEVIRSSTVEVNVGPPSLPQRTPTTPVKFSNKMKRLLDKFRRSDSTANSTSKTDLTSSPATTPTASTFRRGANRSTMVASPNDIRAQMTPMRQAANFQTDKPFDEWDTDMLVDWLTMIGLSMYTAQCRRWVKCGAHIMNATPAEVDKGLGITNHLHRKKLRLAISELNGDCDKITKAAAKLDYLWVARWLDDVGLPQHKEAFINARVDGRVLNYLTVEDLVSMGVKSVLHHASIRCGIKVLRSIQFDLQLLKRRATAEEIEQISPINPQIAAHENHTTFRNTNETRLIGDPNISLWTCHRLMEWLRLIDFAEFAPNLRGSGVHGGLIVFEDGFNFDTLCSLLSIPIGSTLLRRHLSTYFKDLIGRDLVERKRQYQDLSTNQQLNPLAEIKTSKKSQLWFTKLKSSKVAQDGMDEYLCPMYPVEPQIIKSPGRKIEVADDHRELSQLSKISESINV